MFSTYTAEEDLAMRKDYEKGMTLRQIGDKYYCSWSCARKHIVKAGGKMRPKKFPRGNHAMFINDWNAGLSLERIAKTYGYKNKHSLYGVAYYLRQQGYRLNNRPTGRKPAANRPLF